MSRGETPQVHALKMKEMESQSFTFWKQILSIWKCNFQFANICQALNPSSASSDWINLGCFRYAMLPTSDFLYKKNTVIKTPSPSAAKGSLSSAQVMEQPAWDSRQNSLVNAMKRWKHLEKTATQLKLIFCHCLKLCPGITMFSIITEWDSTALERAEKTPTIQTPIPSNSALACLPL